MRYGVCVPNLGEFADPRQVEVTSSQMSDARVAVQIVVNVVEHGMPVAEAISAPRVPAGSRIRPRS